MTCDRSHALPSLAAPLFRRLESETPLGRDRRFPAQEPALRRDAADGAVHADGIVLADEPGDPTVNNGLSLCKIHHAAFDQLLIGIRPDYVVEVHPRVLEESDGPMLRHGLQGLHKSSLLLPAAKRDHPDPTRLEVRYGKFRGAA